MVGWQILLFPVLLSAALRPCNKRQIPGSDINIVCVCNASYCDDIEELGSLSSGQVGVYLTSKRGDRFDKKLGKFNPSRGGGSTGRVEIQIDASTRYQPIIGFGGSFTDAAGINLNKLSPGTRKQIIQQYYGKNGIEYTIGRVPIASCDFSTHQYSYVDEKDDFELKTFKLAQEDFEAKIPYIIQALNFTNNQLKLFASPWSPPAWFKDSDKMAGPGTLKGPINGAYYQSYAKYIVKFFEEYSKNGVLFWGVTTQNEPSSGLIPFYKWETMWLSPLQQQQFIKNHLGPYLRRNKVTSKIKIMVHDDGLSLFPTYTNEIFEDPEAASYIDGVGIHWYYSDVFGRDGLNTHHEKHPDKFILSTEACNGYEMFDHGPSLGSWERGDRYGQDIIKVLQRWSTGWTDWNLALDEQGGPNWAKNFVDSPVIVNATSDEFYKQPMFYVLGHFSKFIPPNSARISSKMSNLPYGNRLESVAFVTPSSQRVLVVLNSHFIEAYDLVIKDSKQDGTFEFQIPPHSIATFIWNK